MIPRRALHFHVEGDGSPLVLLHGFGAHAFTWRHLIGPLAERRRVIALDLKGFGASPKPADGRYAPLDHAAVVREFLAAEGLTDVVLVGHSFGGAVALLSALDEAAAGPNASRVRGLVLIGSPAYRQAVPRFIRLFRRRLVGELVLGVVPPRMLARAVLAEGYADPRRIRAEQVEAYAAPLAERRTARAILATARQLVPPDLDAITARYAGLRLPVLLVWGDRDVVVPVAIARRLHAALPGAELVVIEDCGHIPQEERPAETLAALEAFLGRLGAP